MSSGFAILVGLSLYAIATIPLLIVARWPSPAAAYGLGIAILVVALLQAGTLHRRESIDISGFQAAAPQASRCKRALDALIQASVVLMPPSDGEMVVNKEIWDKLPDPIQETVLICAQQSDTSGSEGGQVRIIKR